MKREDIAHLATLARLELSEQELENFEGELSSIMSYVGAISDIASEVSAPEVGVRHNVFRADVVTNEADEYSADLLAQMPHTEGRYLKVKKILGATEQ
jgi:aspartyl-tRNA(Asn)/glutamyl-tRNA(Gln) amidotransferase subunit C